VGENIKVDMQKSGEKKWTGYICLRVAISGRLLSIQ
jgi:hypothetical protein